MSWGVNNNNNNRPEDPDNACVQQEFWKRETINGTWKIERYKWYI